MKNYIVFAGFFLFFLLPVCSLATSTQETSAEETVKTGKSIKSDQELLDGMNKEEKKWYKKFQKGLMLFDGWEQISQDILSGSPEEERDKLEPLLDTLGVRIGTEWSKANEVRKIDTDMLKKWGKRLKKAKKKGSEILSSEVQTIHKEVEEILLQ